MTGHNVLARHGRPARAVGAVLLALLAVGAASCGSRAATPRALRGERVEVLGVWEGAEAAAFEAVLRPFERETGADVTFTSTAGEDIGAVLDRRLAGGDPPDLALLPQPGLLDRYARRGSLHPIGGVVGEEVARGWSRAWRALGSVDGRLYGLWFKAANKSLLWYSVPRFEQAGVVPPTDLRGLAAVAEQLAADGPVFALAGTAQDAWTATDWFENVYLRTAGPARYDALAERRLPWTDPSVRRALDVVAALLRPGTVRTGADLSLEGAIATVFRTDPDAAMLLGGDFVRGLADPASGAEVGIDVDVFPFPGTDPLDRSVVAGGDAAVLLVRSPAGEALLRHLASPEAAEVWARRGGFLSPNQDVDLRAYPDPSSRRTARALLQAGDELRFDLSDLQPAAFGGTTGRGMFAELGRFVRSPDDVDGTVARLEAAAAEAWGER